MDFLNGIERGTFVPKMNQFSASSLILHNNAHRLQTHLEEERKPFIFYFEEREVICSGGQKEEKWEN